MYVIHWLLLRFAVVPSFTVVGVLLPFTAIHSTGNLVERQEGASLSLSLSLALIDRKYVDEVSLSL